MDDATKKRIVQLLKSGEKEMCNLAVNMFTGLTNQYRDYWDIRNWYQPVGIFVANEDVRGALNRMFNELDGKTVLEQYFECSKEEVRHIKDARRTSINSKQKRKQYKENFKKAKNLCKRMN